MTVSKLHDYMTEKVIPESVMPQNITAVLMDEDAAIPELDAFTFLNRVRALGIGSADFIYLLKGCDAPAEAIEKIENNPAMNLQSLIVTMEESGLTPKDYTRMLYTARQIWERTLTLRLEKVEEDAEYIEEYEEDYYDEEPYTLPEEYPEAEELPPDDFPTDEDEDYSPAYERYQRITREEEKPSHKGKIIAAAAGSCVLIGLCAAMRFGNILPAAEEPPTAHYAADNTEVFTAIYNAYSAGIHGGESVLPPADTSTEAFGEMLVTQSGGLGVYNVGDSAFSATSELITVYTEKNSSLKTLCTIAPPEGAEFVEIVCEKDILAAVFTDEHSVGFAAYDENGSLLYTTHQVGTLTDICTSKAGAISFGTVYTPRFTESFTSERTDKYLPIISAAGTASVIPSQSIAVTDSSIGCSYAVYAEFSLADGSLTDCAAALGDPVYSDADRFMAAMKTSEGYDLITEDTDGSLLTTSLPSLVACDLGSTVMVQLGEDAEPYDSMLPIEREWNVVATAQKEADGSTTVYLHGFDFDAVSAITNIPTEVKSLRMEDGVLYICDENGVSMALDIRNPETPAILQLTQYNGIIRGNNALCSSLSGDLLRFTLYTRDADGIVTETTSTTKSVNAAPDSVIEVAGANSLFIGDDTRCAAAFTYFDGVSVISEYALFGKTNVSYTLFDDKNGFSAAVGFSDRLYLIYGNSFITA